MSLRAIPRALAREFAPIHERQELLEGAHVAASPDAAAWGLEVKDFGDGLVAQRCAAFPDDDTPNHLAGFEARLVDRLPEIVAWFDAAACMTVLRCRAEEADAALSERLAASGYVLDEVEAWPAAWIDDVAPGPQGLDIVEAKTAEDAAVYAEALCDGWEIEAAARGPARLALGVWPGPETWRRYVGYVDGVPAAEALLTLHGRLGYLAEASTVPAFRGRGLQKAMIARRAADARAAGCDIVFASTRWRDASCANMEAMGLRVADVTLVWRRPARNVA